MVVLTENLRRTAHYLVSEADGFRSRDVGLIASGSGEVEAGAVLGRITASKKFVPLAPAASDGSQNAVAILFESCDATSKDVRRTITARDAEVQAAVLVWANGVTDSQKTAALAQLAALGIAAR
ncbi:head decoration protein [Rhizobium skierniewicense]|uniref:head decoration protein n=1 Tax=Rhizobium skierniewicense TaxID=984260 RepID=UPI001574DB63|nr:head decoration protein [Rhizobium skierniewicense]NTF32312.1 head decoration protein [Rhizobium skierniewicense]